MSEVLVRDPARRPPPVPRELGLPVALDALLGAALALDPGRRPASAADLGHALLALAATPGPTPGPTTVDGPGPDPVPGWPVGRVVLLTLLAFVCAATAAYLLGPA